MNSICNYCKSRYSWECDDGLSYPENGCKYFCLDYYTLDEDKRNKIINLLKEREDNYNDW